MLIRERDRLHATKQTSKQTTMSPGPAGLLLLVVVLFLRDLSLQVKDMNQIVQASKLK